MYAKISVEKDYRMNELEKGIKQDCYICLHKQKLENDYELITIYYKPDNVKDVLAYWETTPTRKKGYNAGHYSSSIIEANKDYAHRTKQLLQFDIGLQVNLSSKQKKG